jgi:uncharacterized membrane protein
MVQFGPSAAADAAASGWWWSSRRNCSLSPRQLLGAYLSLCVLSLGVAGALWSAGATLVMPFAWLELAGLGVALLVYSRHAIDAESIRLQDGRLTVEQSIGSRVMRVDFRPDWVRVEPEHGDGSLVELSGHGQRVRVGRFVRPELRRHLAAELRRALRGRVLPGGAA